MECNKKFGWTADETLKLIQSLYEKKVTTYPRVDTTYLSDDIYPQVPGILTKMSPYASLTAPVLASVSLTAFVPIVALMRLTWLHTLG